MHIPRIKLRYRLMLLLAGITSISFILAMSQAIVILQGIQRDNVLEQEQSTAKNTSREIVEFIGVQFARLDTIDSVYPSLVADPGLRQSLLEQMLFHNDAFKELSLVNAEGNEIFRISRTKTIRQEDLRDQSDSKKFLEVRDRGRFIGEVFWERNKPFFTVGRAIFSAQGSVSGAVFAEVDAEAFQRVISKLFEASDQGRVYIVDRKGIVVAHPDTSTVLAEKDFSSIPIVQSLIEKTPEGFLTDIYNNELGEEVISTGSVISLSFEEREPRGVLKTDWFVITEIPTFVAFSSVREITILSLFILLAIVLLSAAAALLFARRIVEPIEALHKGAKEIGLGNLDYALDIKTNDELQDLANEFQRMSKNLKDARERDQEVSRMKSEFLSIAAHQLRTPLSALKWVLNLSLEGDLGKLKKEQRELLEKGYSANERMIALVNDLLDVVRIEEGRFDYKLEKGAVAEIVEDVVKEIKVIAEQKGVQLSFHKPSRKLPKVVLDPVKYRLAVANVIDNAVQYTRASGRVDIEFMYKGNEILVSVKDTGIGIAPRQLSRLFTKFFRADNAVRMETAGSGLGLFIAKNIIEKHGGKIWIESVEGKGTTVYFTVPVAERRRS